MYSITPWRCMSASASGGSLPHAAAGVDRRGGDVVEALRAPGAHVEDARLPRMIEEVEIDRDHVVDGHEIAPLLAVAVAAAALEELDLAARAKLVEEMERDRRHAALVLLVRRRKR